jgi:rod shape-determining protein MreC
MESFYSRYRNLLVLAVVLVAQIIGLAVQVRRTDSGHTSYDQRDSSGVRLIRLWTESAVSIPEKLVHGARMGVVYLWNSYADLRHVHQQNQELQKTIDRLRLEQATLLEDAKQGQRLQTMLNFQEKYVYKTLAAQVIGSSGSDQSKVFYIDKGKDSGLEPDMPVITPDGIVGKIREVFPRTAQVLAINDQTSGAGVILESTRLRGILRGNADGKPQVVGILADQRIQPGENILTAGGDLIFPRGLAVGVVEKVVRDPERDAYVDVIVKPAAHLNQLDEVLVITATEARFPPDQQQDLAESEALKGADAAALKQKEAAIAAERLPGLKDTTTPDAKQNPTGTATGQNGQAQTGQPGAAQVPVVTDAEKAQQMPRPRGIVHPDRFSPATATPSQPSTEPSATPKSTAKTGSDKTTASGTRTAPATGGGAKSAAKPAQPGAERRNQ